MVRGFALILSRARILAAIRSNVRNHYLRASRHDEREALALYEWNIRLANAIMHDIAHIEVAVRNIYDATISSSFHGQQHWLFDPDSPVVQPLLRTRRGKNVDLNAKNRESIQNAIRRIRTDNPDSGQVIAELPFGFWRHLTDAAHEKSLWVPHLTFAFPKGTDRKHIERLLTLINEVRNRASHHEPLFTTARRTQLVRAQCGIVEIARLLLPPLAGHIQATSTLHQVIAERTN
ncbi:Abi family protein [Corynebacterium hindlerae]|uniref:Abi family protein n=1 Tax=Corynebacterium hindlerae TaxID=699041 RepID=UPI003AAFD9C5